MFESSQKITKYTEDSIIKLNVGGELFMTLYSTLSKSVYFVNFLNNTMGIKTMVNEDEIFLDRSAELFREILLYLRTAKVFCRDLQKLQSLQEEAEYFPLPEMIQAIEAKKLELQKSDQLPEIYLKSLQEMTKQPSKVADKKRKFKLIEETEGSSKIFSIVDTIYVASGKCTRHPYDPFCACSVVPHFVLARPKSC
jgi:hypothetical protein